MADKADEKMADLMLDKMTPKQKEILRVQRSLLSKNIVWTPTLANNLKDRYLLTESMITQINTTPGPENKIMLMLDLLPLRTYQVYDKFADALHVSGHTLLADFLREEDLSEQPLDIKDLFRRLPFLTKNLKDPEKKDIENYVSEKIQSAILAHTWQWNTKDKDKALISKQDQIEQAFLHQQEMNKKDLKVMEAERAAQEAREETEALRAELRSLTENSNRVQQHMKGQIDTQMRFSMANDSIAQRSNQRLKIAEQTLKTIQDKLRTVVKLTPRDKERELMKLADNPFHFLPEDTDLFIVQFKKLVQVQTKYEKLADERNAILTQMGFPLPKPSSENEENEVISLLKAFKDFAFEKDEEIQSLKKETARQGELLQNLTKAKEEEERKIAQAGTVWQHAIMSVMRQQLQDLKGNLRKKETTLGIKDEEILKLRTKVTRLEQTLASKTKEADFATRAVKIIELQASAIPDDLDVSVPDPSSPIASTNHTQTLPPLRSSLSHKTSSSPRPGVLRASQRANNISMPRGVVMDNETSSTMYPAGLSTMQIKVQREDSRHGGFAYDPRSRTQMGSSVGDLKAMHGFSSRYPVSRGGAGGMGLDTPSHHSNKRVASPTSTRRKVPTRVK